MLMCVATQEPINSIRIPGVVPGLMVQWRHYMNLKMPVDMRVIVRNYISCSVLTMGIQIWPVHQPHIAISQVAGFYLTINQQLMCLSMQSCLRIYVQPIPEWQFSVQLEQLKLSWRLTWLWNCVVPSNRDCQYTLFGKDMFSRISRNIYQQQWK